ncbi:MAG: fibronectin type III domain-containing protein [Candidatus Cloacimonetes bacterium]|nr:fibronectin type III domain-containing protein [Candidatus Cloacimonadota bacterium]
MSDYVDHRDLHFNEQADTLVKGLTKYMAQLNISQGQIDDLSTKQTVFSGSLQVHLDTQLAAKTATGLKNDNREVLERTYRSLATFVQNNPASTNEIIQECGLPRHDTTPSVIVAVEPTDLKAVGKESGTISLNWKSGGNKQGTIYVIENKHEGDADFKFVDVSTATKYNHKGQTPGVFVLYRVLAKRGTQLSEPSNEVAVYG